VVCSSCSFSNCIDSPLGVLGIVGEIMYFFSHFVKFSPLAYLTSTQVMRKAAVLGICVPNGQQWVRNLQGIICVQGCSCCVAC
jgi:hypothetical protein